MKLSIRLVLLTVMFCVVLNTDAGWFSEQKEKAKNSWNKRREKYIDPAGDKAEEIVREARDDVKEEYDRGKDNLNQFREKYIDPIGDAKSVDEFIDATGNATVKLAVTPLKVTYEGVVWTAELANESVIKPTARYFKRNWDELQESEPVENKYEKGPWIDRVKVYNGLKSNIMIAVGDTEHKNFSMALASFSVPNEQGRKLRLPEQLKEEKVSVFVKWDPSYCKDQGHMPNQICWVRVHYGIHTLPLNISVTYDEFHRINVKYDKNSLLKDLN